jgi:hypothetical protein
MRPGAKSSLGLIVKAVGVFEISFQSAEVNIYPFTILSDFYTNGIKF